MTIKTDLPAAVLTALDILNDSGYEAYCVGGCVRDAALGKEPSDYDIATSALPEQVVAVFSEFRVIETGLKHGTVTVLIDEMQLEITTFRIDGCYSDGRRPDSVVFTLSLEEDLRRRDFTINAMAYSPASGLIDPFGGMEDLFGRRIRCVGNPLERFDEDALRILRAVRFASTLGFSVEEDTAAAVHYECCRLECVSAERLAAELSKLIVGGNALEVLLEYSDVMAVLIPEIQPCIGFEQHSRYHKYDVWKHICYAVDSSPPELDIRLAVLLHDIGKPVCFTMDEQGHGHFHGHEKLGSQMAAEALTRLRYPAAVVNMVKELIAMHYVLPLPERTYVRRIMSKIGEEKFYKLIKVISADNSAKAVEADTRLGYAEAMKRFADELIKENACIKLSDLQINGTDLIGIGLSGKEIGNMLSLLLEMVIADILPNNHDELMKFAVGNAQNF